MRHDNTVEQSVCVVACVLSRNALTSHKIKIEFEEIKRTATVKQLHLFCFDEAFTHQVGCIYISDSHTVELKCMSLSLPLSLLLILFFINKIIAELSLVKECSHKIKIEFEEIKWTATVKQLHLFCFDEAFTHQVGYIYVFDSHTVDVCPFLSLSLAYPFFIDKIIAELSLIKECSQSNAING